MSAESNHPFWIYFAWSRGIAEHWDTIETIAPREHVAKRERQVRVRGTLNAVLQPLLIDRILTACSGTTGIDMPLNNECW